jgi:hypothetical protein
MSMELLRQIAATPLPTSFAAPKDVDAVRILRQAGLFIAVPEEPPEGAVKVVAITEKGHEELLRLHDPRYRAPDPRAQVFLAPGGRAAGQIGHPGRGAHWEGTVLRGKRRPVGPRVWSMPVGLTASPAPGCRAIDERIDHVFPLLAFALNR